MGILAKIPVEVNELHEFIDAFEQRVYVFTMLLVGCGRCTEYNDKTTNTKKIVVQTTNNLLVVLPSDTMYHLDYFQEVLYYVE